MLENPVIGEEEVFREMKPRPSRGKEIKITAVMVKLRITSPVVQLSKAEPGVSFFPAFLKSALLLPVCSNIRV